MAAYTGNVGGKPSMPSSHDIITKQGGTDMTFGSYVPPDGAMKMYANKPDQGQTQAPTVGYTPPAEQKLGADQINQIQQRQNQQRQVGAGTKQLLGG